MIKHIVIFKYKSTATAGQIQQATDAFRDLKNKIPGILAFEHGPNISSEDLNLGFNHAYALTFVDEQARDAYLPHAEHARFGDLLGELDAVEAVFVVDYVPQE